MNQTKTNISKTQAVREVKSCLHLYYLIPRLNNVTRAEPSLRRGVEAILYSRNRSLESPRRRSEPQMHETLTFGPAISKSEGATRAVLAAVMQVSDLPIGPISTTKRGRGVALRRSRSKSEGENIKPVRRNNAPQSCNYKIRNNPNRNQKKRIPS